MLWRFKSMKGPVELEDSEKDVPPKYVALLEELLSLKWMIINLTWFSMLKGRHSSQARIYKFTHVFFSLGFCIYIHVPPCWIFRIPGKENALLGEIPLGFWRLFFQQQSWDCLIKKESEVLWNLEGRCDSLSQWPNFKLFGITYLVGKIKFKLFFSGSIGWVRWSQTWLM